MKNIKKLFCIALTVLICFSLVGCNVIDNMRKAQIHFNDDGNLVYDGKEYKMLPICDAFSPDISFNKNLYITDKDVPVLLSEQYGGRAYLTDDELYIYSHTYSNDSGTTSYFARSDIYDKIANRINDGNYFDGFCFYFNYWDENDDIPSYKQAYEIISEVAESTIKEIITNGIPDEEIDIDLMYQFAVTDLYACSNDLLFKDYAVTIYKTEKFIYIAANTGLNKAQVFKVSDEYYNTVNAVINNYYTLQDGYDGYIPE